MCDNAAYNSVISGGGLLRVQHSYAVGSMGFASYLGVYSDLAQVIYSGVFFGFLIYYTSLKWVTGLERIHSTRLATEQITKQEVESRFII